MHMYRARAHVKAYLISVEALLDHSSRCRELQKWRFGNMSKRARQYCCSGQSHTCMKLHASDNAHRQDENGEEVKNTASNSAAPTISFQSRKIRNVFISEKEKTQLTQETILEIPVGGQEALLSEDAVAMAIEHLKESDLKLCSVIEMHEKPKFQKCQGAFQTLVQSIVYQQLSIKSAASIHNRLVSLCGGEIGVIPDKISELSAVEMRKIGLSERKASYIHDLASKFLSGDLSESSICEMSDDSLISSLTAVKGIGVWSVHMFMIFALHRPDVLPVGDLGVRKGVQKLYNLKDLPAPAQMEVLCNSWRPYRSIGSWYMWRLAGAKGPIFTSE